MNVQREGNATTGGYARHVTTTVDGTLATSKTVEAIQTNTIE